LKKARRARAEVGGQAAVCFHAEKRQGGTKVPSFDEIASFVRDQTGYCGPLTEAATLQTDLGVLDEALWELLGIYVARFAVDVSGFRWYFHSTRRTIFKLGWFRISVPTPPVEHIPITLGMLRQFGGRGIPIRRPVLAALLARVVVIVWRFPRCPSGQSGFFSQNARTLLKCSIRSLILAISLG
jgi:hypothetical protein